MTRLQVSLKLFFVGAFNDQENLTFKNQQPKTSDITSLFFF